jgi:hypothetical protein
MDGRGAHLAGLGRCIIYHRRNFARCERPKPFDSVDLIDHVGDADTLLDALSAIPAVVIWPQHRR